LASQQEQQWRADLDLNMRFVVRTPRHRAFNESVNSTRIVVAAKRQFLLSGGSTFTIRKVATQAGMSMGAVQHFYPTRDQLLAAMLEYVAYDYEAAYDRLVQRLPRNGEARLKAAVDYLIADTTLQDTRQFFFALWALSSHNRTAATLVDQMYFHYRQNLAIFIAAARPQFSKTRCLNLALHIGALIEGTMLFTAPRGNHFKTTSSLQRQVRAFVMRALSTRRQDRPPSARRAAHSPPVPVKR
jgi:AcrR family transcriptional regulator